MAEEDQLETIALIGAGRLGQAPARMAPPARGEVVIATGRGPEPISQLVGTLAVGTSPGTIRDAADGSAST